MKFVRPSIEYRDAYLEMIADWERTGEHMVPFTLRYDYEDFDSMVEKLNSFSKMQDRDWVHHSSFWLIVDEKIVGTSNIRHYLNRDMLGRGGHIGYGVAPSCRRRGYATKILELSLIEAGKLGVCRALLTCDKTNRPSAKTIIKNGGQYWRDVINPEDQELIEQYWIDIPTNKASL